ncbi:hypothetical protein [Streptomyces cavernae]|uniref:hypothetical protein n=1 Tax=Streptomyces cavernae TaxID=2259034 RepID=UPI000FEBD6C3|nr:hypothetical protein [Streptomyces cavernae]
MAEALLAAAAGVTVLGAAAGTGKTGISIGILRSLARRGVPCAPFKAVAVVAPDDPALPSVPPWQRGVLHSCAAAHVPVEWWNNPVLVDLPQPGAIEGDLYVRGERMGRVTVSGEDSLNIATLPDRLRRACEEAVHDGYDRFADSGRWPLVEGAAGVGELEPQDDLANQIVPARAGLPVLLVTNPRRSGHLAALTGLPWLLAPALRDLVLGFVLNQVTYGARLDVMIQRLTLATGLRLLGTVADSPLPSDYDGSPFMLETLYERRAAYVRESGLLDSLPLPTPVGSIQDEAVS